MSEVKNFVDKALLSLKELTILRVNTLVGTIEENAEKTGYDLAPSNLSGMVSEIHLVSGDINTFMSEDFTTPEKTAIREFHQNKEAQAKAIVEANLELVGKIVKTIKGLVAEAGDDDTSTTTPTPATPTDNPGS